MDLIATLIAPADDEMRQTDGHLNDGLLADVRAALSGSAPAGDPVWLAEGAAAEIVFAADTRAEGDRIVRAAVDGLAVDTIVQPAGNRRKRLLIADMDSTIVTSETLDELAEACGLKAEIAEITQRAMNGELDFEAAVKERVGMLKGLPEQALTDTLAGIELTGGARELVATMKANGAYCVLISGGFEPFAAPIARKCGFDAVYCNRLDIADGALTGRVLEPILDQSVKLDTLKRTAREHGLSTADCLATGDGANDLPMLLEAGLGIAFHARPNVRLKATHRLDRADLTGLLYAQGYRRAEFIVP